jgi:hypothetical protein
MSTVQYQGVYRARALMVEKGVITAYVPQVFGDTTITITDVIGGLPAGPSMGWVFFESGWTEFPVWTSGLVNLSGGNGNGTSGGVNEVWVGPDAPPDTTTELWYDTDATAPVTAARYITNYATAAARTSGMPAPVLNAVTTLDSNPGILYVWDGATWQPQR